ncbi:MAG TPA: hypothetical protein VNT50_07840 [Microbacterium sp.]|uniref:hypothetical protein n=1 Tax=Microbacterium sp. TaxID=51671 RepID=UPI002C3E232F|nr:hypothetical protein [Microbacterium sp.]HWI31388.1 hypothetical protein [Microbacterium sp.]
MSNPQDSRDLPEGVIDAEPTGGWESEAAASTHSGDEQSADEQSDDRTTTGLPPNTPDGTDATADAPAEPADPAAPTAPAGPIEGDAAGRGADPDMLGDADLGEGRSEDPNVDPDARRRQDGL